MVAAMGTSRLAKTVSWLRTTSRTRAGELITTHSLLPRSILKIGPCLCAKLVNFSSKLPPRNGKYPRTGTPRGPGGNGAGPVFGESEDLMYQRMEIARIERDATA